MAQSKVGLLVRIKTRATLQQDDPGVPAASPYINIINQQAKVMLKAASELGFTPVSRPRAHSGLSAPSPRFNTSLEVDAAGRPDGPSLSLEDYLVSAPKPPIVH